MQFRSLKTAIFFNLFFLLALALVLTALAMTGLWHDRLARQEKNAFIMLARLQAGALAGQDEAARLARLKALCAAAGDACQRVALRQDAGETLVATGAASAVSLSPDRLIQIDEAIPGEDASLFFTVRLAAPSDHFRRDLSLILSLVAVNALIFAAIGFFRLARGMVRPLERLTDTAGRYAGELDALFHHERGGELRRLASALRGLFARIERDTEQIKATVARLEEARAELTASQKEIVRAEKLASIGRLAAGLAHEIGNPLGIVQGYLALLRQDDLTTAERADFAERATIELARVSGLIRNLLDFSRPARIGRESANLAECLDKLLPVLRAQKEAREVSLIVEGEIPTARLPISPDALYQVLLNCLLNAIDAIASRAHGDAGRIIIRCQVFPAPLEAPAQPRLAIGIADNGGGVEERYLDSLFDPFFTTKEPGQGTGLGLSVSHSLIEAAGGAMRLDNNEEGGATVVIELPLSEENPSGKDHGNYPDH